MNYDAALAALSSAAGWRKSTWSEQANACVELTTEVAGWIGVRDSKLGARSPILAFSATEWAAFTTDVRADELD
jgi:hypothetical protein